MLTEEQQALLTEARSIIASEHFGTAADLCDLAIIEVGADPRPKALEML